MSISQIGSFKRLVTLTTTAGVMGLTTLLTMTSAQAATINGGFENGFTGWGTIGNTSIKTSSYGSGPTEGNSDALISAPADNSDALPSALETFLGLSSGNLDGVNGPISHGSAISQTLSLNAGDTLSFDWNFLTNESQAQNNNDFAFVTINNLLKLGDTSSPLVSSATPFVGGFANETGFRTFVYTIPTTGTYTLGIGVANVGDAFGGSGVLVDRVAVAPAAIPTPPAGVGLLALGILSLRSKLVRKR